MPLQMFRRHTQSCTGKYIRHDRTHQDCRCPFQVEGKIGGQFIRKSLETSSERAARKIVAAAEERGSWDLPAAGQELVRIDYAIDCKLAQIEHDCEGSTLIKWKFLLKQERAEDFKAGETSPTLDEFCRYHGLVYLKEITTNHMEEFKRLWHDGPLALQKKLERLRGFFRYSIDSGWLDQNPARRVSGPTKKQLAAIDPTLPLTEPEIELLYRKLPEFFEQRKKADAGTGIDSSHADRFRVLLMVMEYAGLAIGDAVALKTTDIVGDTIELRRAKTQSRVPGVPLPAHVLAALQSLPLIAGKYFFWTGVGPETKTKGVLSPRTACGNYRRTLRELGEFAGIHDLHPHRLRNTFAKRLLLEGVPIETVAKYMGHKDVRITQRHYNAWIGERDDRAAELIRQVWAKRREKAPKRLKLVSGS